MKYKTFNKKCEEIINWPHNHKLKLYLINVLENKNLVKKDWYEIFDQYESTIGLGIRIYSVPRPIGYRFKLLYISGNPFGEKAREEEISGHGEVYKINYVGELSAKEYLYKLSNLIASLKPR